VEKGEKRAVNTKTDQNQKQAQPEAREAQTQNGTRAKENTETGYANVGTISSNIRMNANAAELETKN
jgi:hypothetical protein